MAFYLVTAEPIKERLNELKEKLQQKDFISLRPFGNTLHQSLLHARRTSDGGAAWEEEDYCSPPLAQEREAVLDRYFKDIEVNQVQQGEGWEQLKSQPYLFPHLVKGK